MLPHSGNDYFYLMFSFNEKKIIFEPMSSAISFWKWLILFNIFIHVEKKILSSPDRIRTYNLRGDTPQRSTN